MTTTAVVASWGTVTITRDVDISDADGLQSRELYDSGPRLLSKHLRPEQLASFQSVIRIPLTNKCLFGPI